eukprot:TRINITY_DN2233_c0_g1_i1.p1 TRINITY_DN2233_c0_g1~~TRINITY_DN2233_c0_g1_i1.p1  ORF type:complete len:766 (-),score=176.44 TRINITY_DN2233_c0_g1_i1:34-2331(-)
MSLRMVDGIHRRSGLLAPGDVNVYGSLPDLTVVAGNVTHAAQIAHPVCVDEFVQATSLVICAAVLILKWSLESSRRSFQVFTMDACKQLFGAGVLRTMSIIYALLYEGRAAGASAEGAGRAAVYAQWGLFDSWSGCSCYLFGYVVDATLGLLFCWRVLRVTEFVLGYTSGWYPPYSGNPRRGASDTGKEAVQAEANLAEWLVQLSIWMSVVCLERFSSNCLLLFFPDLWAEAAAFAERLGLFGSGDRATLLLLAVVGSLQVLLTDELLRCGDCPNSQANWTGFVGLPGLHCISCGAKEEDCHHDSVSEEEATRAKTPSAGPMRKALPSAAAVPRGASSALQSTTSSADYGATGGSADALGRPTQQARQTVQQPLLAPQAPPTAAPPPSPSPAKLCDDASSASERRFEAARLVAIVAKGESGGRWGVFGRGGLQDRLQLYALYKQATAGDADAATCKPGLARPIRRARWEAWSRLAGLTRQDARRRYCELVEEVFQRPCFSDPDPERGNSSQGAAEGSSDGEAFYTPMQSDCESAPALPLLSKEAAAAGRRCASAAESGEEAVFAAAQLAMRNAMAAGNVSVIPADKALLAALAKQATAGDVDGERPDLWDSSGQLRWDAWSKLKGFDKQVAMRQYCETVDRLLGPGWSSSSSKSPADAAASPGERLFAEAQRALAKPYNEGRLGNRDKLLLYALFKQATVGDVIGARPDIYDQVERYKWDFWDQLRGMTAAAAKQEYCNLVDRLAPNWRQDADRLLSGRREGQTN